MDIDSSERFLESSRFWVQRVLVPILVLIGAGGNIVTVMVLTRRRMRCSTNIYLTALAVADLVYILFILILSFEHYPNIHDIRYELYWRFYGINHWLADAASSTSIWLVVCFTVERYIVVCHPIRGKVLCTENRAKRVIAAVSLLCILATVSTAFEYQLTTTEQCITKQCVGNNNNSNADVIQPIINSTTSTFKNTSTNYTSTSTTIEEDEECCVKRYEILTELTNLGRNVTYKTVFYWFTSIMFTFLPLTLIATFNCFLVNAVRKSQVRRKQMTKSQENSTQAQENRMTLILISVVVLFLICQTPTACILIYTSVYTNFDIRTDNIVRGLGNVFNLLVSINAACNFLLYCVLSDKYRRTFRALFCDRRLNRQDTFATSRSGRFNSSQKNGFRRNISAYLPRNYETQSLNNLPRAKTVLVRPTGNRNIGKLV